MTGSDSPKDDVRLRLEMLEPRLLLDATIGDVGWGDDPAFHYIAGHADERFPEVEVEFRAEFSSEVEAVEFQVGGLTARDENPLDNVDHGGYWTGTLDLSDATSADDLVIVAETATDVFQFGTAGEYDVQLVSPGWLFDGQTSYDTVVFSSTDGYAFSNVTVTHVKEGFTTPDTDDWRVYLPIPGYDSDPILDLSNRFTGFTVDSQFAFSYLPNGIANISTYEFEWSGAIMGIEIFHEEIQATGSGRIELGGDNHIDYGGTFTPHLDEQLMLDGAGLNAYIEPHLETDIPLGSYRFPLLSVPGVADIVVGAKLELTFHSPIYFSPALTTGGLTVDTFSVTPALVMGLTVWAEGDVGFGFLTVGIEGTGKLTQAINITYNRVEGWSRSAPGSLGFEVNAYYRSLWGHGPENTADVWDWEGLSWDLLAGDDPDPVDPTHDIDQPDFYPVLDPEETYTDLRVNGNYDDWFSFPIEGIAGEDSVVRLTADMPYEVHLNVFDDAGSLVGEYDISADGRIVECDVSGLENGTYDIFVYNLSPDQHPYYDLMLDIQPDQRLDLIFCIDTTGSMWDDIAAVKSASTAIINEIAVEIPDYRIAVVAYRDFPVSPYGSSGDYTYRDFQSFSTNKDAAISAIQSLSVGGGADWRESVYSGLMHCIDATSLGGWRGQPVKKTIIAMGDAPPHDPEPFTGYTMAEVNQAAEDADPVLIFPVVVGGDSTTISYFQGLADGTGGQLFTAANASEVVDAVMEALEVITYSPFAEAGGPYEGLVGQPIAFDGSGSYDPDGVIVLYEWDWDSDGIYDYSSTEPFAEQTWSSLFFDTLRMRVTDNDGLSNYDTAYVEVGSPLPLITDVSLDATVIDENGTVTLTVDFHDADASDDHSVLIEWDDGASNTFVLTGGERSFSVTHTYLDDDPSSTSSDPYVITATVSDDSASDTATATVTVNNVAPTLGDLWITPEIYAGQLATLSGTIIDPGQRDTFSLEVDWDDDSPTETFTFDAGTTAFLVAHEYPDELPGGADSYQYNVSILVRDDDAGVDRAGWGAADVLIIYDVNNAYTQALKLALEATGMTVSLSTTDETGYNGANPDASAFDAVIHLNGTTYSTDMPMAGQDALVSFVQNGGAFLHGEWNAYEFLNGRMQHMRDLTLFDRVSGRGGAITLSDAAGMSGHPVLANVPSTFTVTAAQNVGSIHSFSVDPATVLMVDESNNDAVAAREFGSGRVVGFHHAGNYGGYGTLSDPNIQQLYIDGVLWATAGAGELRVTVFLNVSPTVDAGPDVTIDEGDPQFLSGSFIDPGQDEWMGTVDYGDGTGVQALVLNADKLFDLRHQYVDDDPSGTPSDEYTVAVMVSDDKGGIGIDTLTVTVRNAAPMICGPDSSIVYYNDFDASPMVAHGVAASLGLESVQGFAGLGTGSNVFDGKFLRNAWPGSPGTEASLTLTGLGPHTSVDVNFLLAIIDSWDGTATSVAPDIFNVEIDGNAIFSRTFDVFDLGDQGYMAPAGVQLTAFPFSNLGFNSDWADAAYDLGLDSAFDNIPHTGDTLTISWFASGSGWQGGWDESWAIENVELILNDGGNSVIVYSNDFDTPPTAAGGVAALLRVGSEESVQGLAGLGTASNVFDGDFLRNDSGGDPATRATLTLEGLEPHSSVDLDFLLAVIDSWDGNTQQGGLVPPDHLNVEIDGKLIFSHTFDFLAEGDQSYVAPAGGQLTPFPLTDLGFNGDWPEAAYDMGLEPAFHGIPHSSETLTISWYASGGGWQAGYDESWAVDNVEVVLHGTGKKVELDADVIDEGGSVTLTGHFFDPGASDVHNGIIEWGDGRPAEQVTVTESGGSGTVSGSHAYEFGGIYTIELTVTDDDTGSDVATTTAMVTGAGLHDGVLQIVGSEDSDYVKVKPYDEDEILVMADFIDSGQRLFPAELVESVHVVLCDGDDYAWIDPSILVDAVLCGGPGNDWLYAGGGETTVLGGAGNDMLYGGVGDDLLDGGAGDDKLRAYDGNDTLLGGDGNDRLYADAGEDVLDGGPGSDEMSGDDGDDVLDGREGADDLRGGRGNDVLDGGAGNDWVRGDDGDDALAGGDGDDWLLGGTGQDALDGGAGNDQLRGEDGDDALFGGDGADKLRGGGGNDVLNGGVGNDWVGGDGGDDILAGGDGDDWLYGGTDQDVLDGGEGHDRLWGENGDDTLAGAAGNDELYGGGGNDDLDGGGGDDYMKGEDGADVLRGSDGADTIEGGQGDDFVDGGAGDDYLRGNDGNDVVVGGDGDDWLNGEGGFDLVIGGLGADGLCGGGGDDILIGSYTSHDGEPAALKAALAMWTSGADYATRVTSIRSSFFEAGTTVFDDGAGDKLAGHSEQDWFFADLDGLNGDDDDLRDLAAGEVVDLL